MIWNFPRGLILFVLITHKEFLTMWGEGYVNYFDVAIISQAIHMWNSDSQAAQ